MDMKTVRIVIVLVWAAIGAGSVAALDGSHRMDVERILTDEVCYRDSVVNGVYGIGKLIRNGRLIEGRRIGMLSGTPNDTVTAMFLSFGGRAPRYMIYTPNDTVDFLMGEVDAAEEDYVPYEFRKGIDSGLCDTGVYDEIRRSESSGYVLSPDFNPRFVRYVNPSAIDLYVLVVRIFTGDDGSQDYTSREYYFEYQPNVNLPFGGPYIYKYKEEL